MYITLDFYYRLNSIRVLQVGIKLELYGFVLDIAIITVSFIEYYSNYSLEVSNVMSTIIDKLIEEFKKGKKPKDLIKEGYKRSTVYLAYKRFKEREEAKKKPIVEVFKRLEEGKTLPRIVVETGLDPDEVKKCYEKWLELKKIDINQPTVLKDIEELKRKLKPLLELTDKDLRKLKAYLNTVTTIRCPVCHIEFNVGRSIRVGSSISCPKGHSFTLQNQHIVAR